jgi:hypothetical protein
VDERRVTFSRGTWSSALAIVAIAVLLGGARAAYELPHRPAATDPAAPDSQDTRVEVKPLGRARTEIWVLVRKGTVRLERDSIADSTLRTEVPAVLMLSSEVTWLRITTEPELRAVQVRIAGMALKPHEMVPWGRVVTFRKVDGRWQSETMFLRADSLPRRARP